MKTTINTIAIMKTIMMAAIKKTTMECILFCWMIVLKVTKKCMMDKDIMHISIAVQKVLLHLVSTKA